MTRDARNYYGGGPKRARTGSGGCEQRIGGLATAFVTRPSADGECIGPAR